MAVDIVCVGFGPAMGGFLTTLSRQLVKEDGTPAVESAAAPGMPPQVLCYERADDIGFGVSGVVTRARGLRASFPNLDPKDIPMAECLKDTVARVLPYWHETIVPAIKSGKRVLVAAHGNSMRALIKYLDNMPEDEIVGLNVPTGIPLVYEFNDDMTPIRHYYLGDQEAINQAVQKVADQTKKK